MADTMLVTMTAAQLESLVEKAVDRALAKARPSATGATAPVLNSDEAAAYLKMPVGVLRKRVRKGEVPSFKIGSLLRFRVTELEAWLDSLQERKAG